VTFENEGLEGTREPLGFRKRNLPCDCRNAETGDRGCEWPGSRRRMNLAIACDIRVAIRSSQSFRARIAQIGLYPDSEHLLFAQAYRTSEGSGIILDFGQIVAGRSPPDGDRHPVFPAAQF